MKFNNLVQNSVVVEDDSRKGFIKVKDMLYECYEKESKLPSTHKKIEGYLSISQISGSKACMRKQYYEIEKYDSDEKFSFDSHSILKVGNLYHDLVQSVLIKYGKIEHVESFFSNDEYKICGSIDGIIKDYDGSYILNDFKTISSAGFDYILRSGRAKKDHIAQVHLYRFMIEKQLGIKIDKLKITYLHKNQNHYDLKMDNPLKNLQNTLEYLNDIYNWLEKNGKDTSKVLKQIGNVDSSINTLKYSSEKYENEDYHIKEIDMLFDQSILDAELNKIKEFWELVESNREIRTKNAVAVLKKDIKKEKLPNKISVNYKCNSCKFIQVCRDGVLLK